MPEEFKNRDFTLKMHQMFFVHTMPEEFENSFNFNFTLFSTSIFSYMI